MPTHNPGPAVDAAFARRTFFVFAVAAMLFLVWQVADVLLLAFGAVIIAVLIRSLADPIREHTPMNDSLALLAAGLLILAILGGAGWVFGSMLSSQLTALAGVLPHSMAELREQVTHWPFGGQIAAQLDNVGALPSGLQGLAGRIGGYAMNFVSGVTNLVLVLFAGAFLSTSPGRARDGLVMLLPPSAREPVRDGLNTCGRALRLWLLGTLADMVVTGALTFLGASLIGLPSPAALGLLAGLATFVPVIGPIASTIPGLLVAVQLGPDMLLWTLLMYVIVQQIEGNLIYPFIQRRAVDLPPYLSLLAVMGFGVLFGWLGVIFATPLLVVIYTLTKVLYLRNTLGDDVTAPGEKSG
ncbi:AI-2E family transporter [Phenylobacterium sp.]|uniref:AI-2E family transporter n=1 Tax=Phenylobacterium sp. TaxID=1871053 RepID=UPI0035B3005B